ncbi:MAG TPA: caspase family protein [Bryobacteraceae bacterium]|nr:caspase family protein [Bryobacteraceae bacterium]
MTRPNTTRLLLTKAVAVFASVSASVAQQTLSPSYAVAIGITQYQNRAFPRLDTAEPDAQAMQGFLQKQGFDVTLLLGSKATRSAILGTLRNLAKRIEADRATSARVVVYFAGHGTTETVAGIDYGYLVPWDGTADNTSYISMDDIRDVSARLQTARHQLYLLDSCFGGLLITRDPNPGAYAAQPGYVQDAVKRKAIEVLTAGGKDQRVVSNGPNGHSPFTGALLEALDQGLADMRHDGFITFGELANYVIARASNAYSTPGQGSLPGHGLGEFVFRSPLAPRAVTTSVTPGAKPIFRGDAGPAPTDSLALQEWRWCNDGNAVACSSLGFMYEYAYVGPEYKARAVALYKQGCDGDDANGCSFLGMMYENGNGVPQDHARAVALYKQACDGGSALGCSNLGLMYEHGKGVPQDHARAVALYKQACDGGNANGCSNLGVMYDNGNGGLPKDQAHAVALYKQACDGGSANGCSNLGVMYENGNGGLPKDQAHAVALYKQACDGGDARGCSNLGFMYNNGKGVPKDQARAVALYKQACDGGDALGCSNLGFIYENGNGGLPKDQARAVALYKQACDGGSALGCRNLGDSYENGNGVPKDQARAIALYKQACDGGDAQGCDTFRRLGGQ